MGRSRRGIVTFTSGAALLSTPPPLERAPFLAGGVNIICIFILAQFGFRGSLDEDRLHYGRHSLAYFVARHGVWVLLISCGKDCRQTHVRPSQYEYLKKLRRSLSFPKSQGIFTKRNPIFQKRSKGVPHLFKAICAHLTPRWLDILNRQASLQVIPFVQVLAADVLDLAHTHNRFAGFVAGLGWKEELVSAHFLSLLCGKGIILTHWRQPGRVHKA